MTTVGGIIRLLKRQVEIEKENVKQVSETEKKVDNAAAKMCLLEIRLDSQKHADMLNRILEVLGKTPSSKTLWEHRIGSYADPFVVKSQLEKHMKIEDQMISHIEEEIEQTKDEGLKLLLQHIADDERKHHKLLEEITKHLRKID
ncbi:MAG: ferritin-like domain-containing protein [Candidatus Bathyarchaeota archaeon]|nr:MAG: ferritin-like domain-containing protein [Candidatus Bathyarchaeota archaeon]